MNIIICGAGKTGAHAAEILAADGANVTVVDESQISLDMLADNLDVATLAGQPTAAKVLARRAMASGFLANQVNAANPTAAFSKNVENLTNPENRLPNDFLVFFLNSLPINLNNPGFSELSS